MGAMKKAGAAFDLDFVLGELGQFGRYQLYNYALIVVPIMFSAIYGANYVFTAADLDYRCRVPECEGFSGNTFNHSWLDHARPSAGNDMRCSRFEPLNATVYDDEACPADFFHDNITIACDDWVYASRDTIVYTFQLACEDWKRTLVGTVHSAGLLAALPITGYVSDRFGRKFAFILCSINAGVFGLIRSFAPNYEFYVIFEFLEATLGSGVYSAGFILALELVGFKKRVLGGNIISMFYAVGQIILALLAWGIPEWRTLTRVLYAPSILFILYFYVIQESVRWLLSKGKNKEAIHILIRAAKINKVYFSKQVTSKFDVENSAEDTALTRSETESEELKAKNLVTQVIKSPIILSRLFICSFWWITVTFVYYGLSINVGSLLGNFYVNYILVSAVEIPGYILSVVVLDRFGRKRSLMTGFLICGLANIILPFIPDDLSWLATCLYLLGKMTISMCFSSIYIYTSELFPTNARHSLLGFCSMLGRIGSMVAPQMPLLSIYMDSLPSLLFGAFAITAGLLMLLTPETLNIKLPDNIAEAEDIGKLKIEDPNSKSS